MPTEGKIWVAVLTLALIAGGDSRAFGQAQETPPPSSLVNAPAPEPKHLILVEEDLLSIEVKDMELGKLLSEVARKAGFKTDMSAEIAKKKVSTKFIGLQMEKGIARIMTLIREKNFNIYYAPDGKISKVEVLGGQVAPTHKKTMTTAPAPKRTPLRQALPQQRERYRPRSTQPSPFIPAPEPKVPKPPAPAEPPVTVFEEPAPPENEQEVRDMMDEPSAPFIPPKEGPVFIPPRNDKSTNSPQ